MKNKKGFTLVELLAVIVILALIMGIAIVSIGNVVQDSQRDVMFENAQSVINSLRTTFAIKFVDPDGAYGFNSTIFGGRSVKSPMGGEFEFRDISTAAGDVEITPGLWKLGGTAPSTCDGTTKSYVLVTDGVYKLCLHTNGTNKYIFGTEAEINSNTSTVIK